MNTRLVFICATLLTLLNLSCVYAQDGYGTGADIPYGARAIHLLTNEARCDTFESLKSCDASTCPEVETCRANYDAETGTCIKGTNCIYPALPPLWWDDGLHRAAEMHSAMLSSLGTCLQHPSPCMLVSDIASMYPACDGDPACACSTGIAQCKYEGTDTNKRIKMFLDNANCSTGENIAYMNSGMMGGNQFVPYAMFMTWFHEHGAGQDCEHNSANGHRMNIISTRYTYGSPYNYNMMGVGYHIRPASRENLIHGTQDFARCSSPKTTHALTAGSHYYTGLPTSATLHFKTHYYSESTPAVAVKLALNGECIDLALTRGTAQNGVYGSTSIPAPSKCTPYFFEAKDSRDHIIRFPETGSLLFTVDTEAVNCDGKSWQPASATSCFYDGPKCRADQHLTKDGAGCEDDSVTACGAYDNDCTKQSGWTDGSCIEKTCQKTICDNGYHAIGTSCAPDDLSNCGKDGFSCESQIAGWAGGDCTNGKCVAKACKPGYHISRDICESDDVGTCGPDKINCGDTVPGWLSGTCENNACIPAQCISGYHLHERSCEADSIEHCGDHQTDCSQSVADWASGECSDGQCIVSACRDNKVVSDNQCKFSNDAHSDTPDSHDASDTGNDNTFTPSTESCAGHPMSAGKHAPWLMMIAMAWFVTRKRKYQSSK